MKLRLCVLATVWIAGAAVASGGLSASPAVLAPAKHGGSGIELRYTVPGTLRPGETALVRVQLAGVRSDDARVEFRSESPGVQLRLGGQPITGAIPLEPHRTRSLDIEVSAPDGLQHLNVFTSQGGRFSAHSIPLPVGSGAASLKPGGVPATTPEGEKIISLPSR